MKGIRNSHDKRFPAGMVLGSTVLVCDNLAFSGEIEISRRHTRYVMHDLPVLIDQAVEQLSIRWKEQDRRISSFTGIPDSCCFNVDMICSSVNRFRFTCLPPVVYSRPEDELSNLYSFTGRRQTRHWYNMRARHTLLVW